MSRSAARSSSWKARLVSRYSIGTNAASGLRRRENCSQKRFPVCGPKYLRSAVRLEDPHDLANHWLLFLSSHYGRLTRWGDWLRELGFGDIQTKPGLTFDDHNSLIEAVLASEGIALAGPPQISDYLTQGPLVRVLKPYFTTQSFFWSVRPENRPTKPITLAFESWLEEEMRQSITSSDLD